MSSLRKITVIVASALTCVAIGMQLAIVRRPAAAAARILYYQDPMHPGYRSDRPGTAPDCGMKLEPVYVEGGSASGARRSKLGAVRVTAEKQQAIGIRTGVVESGAGPQSIRTLGRVAIDETRLFRITASSTGWIRRAFPNSVGALVRKDEALASFYSPEFLPAEQAYLFQLGALDRFTATGRETPDQIRLTNANVQAGIDALRNLGMGDRQIAELAKTRELTQDIIVRSPVDGFIVARNISPGLRFEPGTELYRIADLQRVWILADLYGNDATQLRGVRRARVALPQDRQTFDVRVSDVLPQFDGTTRTMKLRLEADNPGYTLRPDMFVDVEFPVHPPDGPTIPIDALVDSGLRQTVFIDIGDGYFEPRTVETGWQFGDRVAITRGLEVGERIVISGNFLIDAETRLRAPVAAAADSPRDPVCGMDVDPDAATHAGHVLSRNGIVYAFCSDDCKRQFERTPARFAGSGR